MKVGELASRTGLTVRTLHHYDEIGLLRPSRRTASGHRMYGMDEVRRLQQITSLRQLGLSLEEIGSCLDRPDFSLGRVLDLQIQRLREDVERQTRLVGLLEGLRRKVDGGVALSLDDVTSAIEATVHLEKYYTQEQLAHLGDRAEALGPRGLQKAQDEWSTVFAGLGEAQRAGLAPDDVRVRELAARARALIHAFTGGDAGIAASLQRMYQDGSGTGVMRGRGMDVDPALMAYYRAAMAALPEDEGARASESPGPMKTSESRRVSRRSDRSDP